MRVQQRLQGMSRPTDRRTTRRAVQSASADDELALHDPGVAGEGADEVVGTGCGSLELDGVGLAATEELGLGDDVMADLAANSIKSSFLTVEAKANLLTGD